MRTIVVLAALTALASAASAGQVTSVEVGPPAFANASFETADLQGWSKFLLLAIKPLEASARNCNLPKASGRKYELASDLAFPGKPTLGGNYWDVTLEVNGGAPPHGRCTLSMSAKDTLVLISPTFTPCPGSSFLPKGCGGSSWSSRVPVDRRCASSWRGRLATRRFSTTSGSPPTRSRSWPSWPTS
jgi:hypothetical protein